MGMAFMGVAFVFVKSAVTGYSPFVFLFYRFLIATMVLSLIFHKQIPKVTNTAIKTASLCGIPLFLSILFQTIGLKYTTVSNSAFITGMVVLLIPIFKMIFYKKKVKPIVWISCVVAMTGLYIITLKNGLKLNIGDLWTVACAMALAFYVLQIGKYAHEPSPMARVTIIMVVCTIGSLLGGLSTPGVNWFPQEYGFWKGLIFTSLLGTVYMYAVQSYGQRFIEEEKVALAYLTEPIFATMAAVFLINEKVTIHTFLGGTLILAAMFLSKIKTDRLKQLVVKVRHKS
ncbi:DMT family transporter [Flavobacterium gawalongense]|uniref:DMT family transporter n=1 Tax=Flavobacterium gawalongense TaxID=2594432 RepID=UPI00163D4EEF|nr:DMT family transporter [Flavobacterium gawalongense]